MMAPEKAPEKKPSPMVVLASIHSQHFHFEACGLTRDEAMEALRKLLAEHGRQYSLKRNWMAQAMGAHWKDDINFRSFCPGDGYRDGERITEDR